MFEAILLLWQNKNLVYRKKYNNWKRKIFWGGFHKAI
jgi:hypothetical protein